MTATFLTTGAGAAVNVDQIRTFRIHMPTHLHGPPVYVLTADCGPTLGLVTLASDTTDHGGIRSWLRVLAAENEGPFFALPVDSARS